MSSGDCGEGAKQYEGTEIGVVTHFFDNISVAAVEVSGDLKIGDTVKIYDKEGDVVVEQEVTSMQIDGEDVEGVGEGEEFGMKVEGEVKEGYLVYKQ